MEIGNEKGAVQKVPSKLVKNMNEKKWDKSRDLSPLNVLRSYRHKVNTQVYRFNHKALNIHLPISGGTFI